MGTNITYNGIDIGEIKTKSVETVAIKDPTGRDVLYYEHTIRAQSIVYVSDNAAVYNPSFDADFVNPTQMMDYLYERLMEPRRSFTMKVDGEVLFESSPLSVKRIKFAPDFPPETHLDANYGPTPVSCEITRLHAASFEIVYEIRFANGLCDGVQRRQAFASHKYATTVKFDQSGYKTFVTNGRIITNSDMREDANVHINLFAPPMYDGYVRTGAFDLSEDGLTLTYAITDKRVHTLPPEGASEAEGTFTIKSQPPGAIIYGNASVRLRGTPDSNRADLMKTAILICLDKLEKAGAKRLKGANGSIVPPIAGMEMRESLYDSEVFCSIEAMLFNDKVSSGSPGPLFNFGGYLGGMFLGPLSGIGIFTQGASLLLELLDGDGSAIEQSIQAGKDAAGKVASNPLAKEETVASQLAAFGTTPYGSNPGGMGFVNNSVLSGTDFERMIIAAFYTPCSTSSQPLILSSDRQQPSLKSRDLFSETTIDRSQSNSLNSNANSSVNSGTTTPSTAVSGQGRINTPTQVGPTRPRTSLNSVNSAFAEVGGPLGKILETGSAIGEASSIISEGAPSETSVDDNELPGLYTKYMMMISEEAGQSRVISRSTQEDGSTLVISFGNPTKGLILSWTATKVGFPPEIPTLADSDQFTYIRSTIDYSNMEMMADNKTPQFTIKGRIFYEYTGSKSYQVTCPPPPWVNIGQNQFLNIASSKTSSIAIADS